MTGPAESGLAAALAAGIIFRIGRTMIRRSRLPTGWKANATAKEHR